MGLVNFTRAFITTGFAHLPPGSPVMFHLDEVCDDTSLKLLRSLSPTRLMCTCSSAKCFGAAMS
jgi:hypothetical protein